MGKKEKYLIIYYAALLAVYVLMAYRSINVGSIIRLGYLLCIVGPLFAFKIEWTPAVTTVFYSVASANYGTTILPMEPGTYIVILIAGLLIGRQGKKQPIPWPLILLVILSFITNLLTEFKVENVTLSLVWLITFFYYSSFEDENQLLIFSYAFLAIALIISVSRLLIGDNFTEAYADGLERTALQDINYSACVVGMGMVSGAILLFKKTVSGLIPVSLIIVTIVLSLFTLAANASRASLLAVAVAVAVLLLFSSIGKIYKTLLMLAIAALIFYMYNNSYFDLLQYRIQNDEGGGSNRLNIWPMKIEAFFSEGNLLNYLFGYGYEPARSMGGGAAFHNDFLAHLCEYGFCGFFAYLALYLIPFKTGGVKNAECIATLLYLAIVCFTLEPIAAGRIPYLAFWFYIMILANKGLNQKQIITNYD